MASADFFKIHVQGKGGHGSAPQQGVDAVLAASAIVMNLQSIVSREVSPLETVVVSIGSINAGTGNNVIASEGTMTGTVRAFNPEVRKQLPGMLTRILENTAHAYRAKATLEFQWGSASIINDPEASRIATQAVRKVGAQPVDFKVTAGEDFSEYMNKVSGVFALVGVRNQEKGAVFPQHNPHYDVDEDALEVGTALYIQYASDFLEASGNGGQ